MKKLTFTIITIVLILSSLEFLVRYSESKKKNFTNVGDLINAYHNTAPDDPRENENRYLIHNAAIYENLIKKYSPEVIFLGSSRTKVLTPNQNFSKKYFVSGGNSYNEITWGLLAEAEAIRQLFPQTKTFWFEASFLLRIPNQFTVEPHHKKYLFLLKDLLSDIPQLNNIAPSLLISAQQNQNIFSEKQLLIYKLRSRYRLKNLFVKSSTENYYNNPQIQKLSDWGEQINASEPTKNILQILPSNEKLVRIQNAGKNIPGDHLFEAIAIWAQKHQLNIGFYLPPLKIEFLKAQHALGIQDHINDLLTLSKKYQIPIVNFLDPRLNWITSATLFGDEDHLSTCQGSYALTRALIDAVENPTSFQLKSPSFYLPQDARCQGSL